jgi:hypothetical protein
VGKTAILVCVFSLSPFVIMVAWGAKGYQHPENWRDLPEGGWDAVQWGPLLNIMFWCVVHAYLPIHHILLD